MLGKKENEMASSNSKRTEARSASSFRQMFDLSSMMMTKESIGKIDEVIITII